MIQLTKSQKEVMLQLGASSSFEAVPMEVLNELILLNLICKRSDGNLDFTETGEMVYNKLANQDKGNKK